MPTTTPLTPIDTGEVAEPHVWRTTRPAYMGRVDFDNDEGSTLATVRMERNENGGYDLLILPFMLEREEINVVFAEGEV